MIAARRFFHGFGILASFLLASGRPAAALGRRPDAPVHEHQPERGPAGSPANPNPAFAPPRFGDDGAPAPASERPSKNENPGRAAAPPAAVTPTPAPDASVPAYQPLPQPPPLPPDASEPPLPDDPL